MDFILHIPYYCYTNKTFFFHFCLIIQYNILSKFKKNYNSLKIINIITVTNCNCNKNKI